MGHKKNPAKQVLFSGTVLQENLILGTDSTDLSYGGTSYGAYQRTPREIPKNPPVLYQKTPWQIPPPPPMHRKAPHLYQKNPPINVAGIDLHKSNDASTKIPLLKQTKPAAFLCMLPLWTVVCPKANLVARFHTEEP